MNANELLTILEEELRKRAQAKESPVWRDEEGRIVIRGSSAGKCTRALWYWLHRDEMGFDPMPSSLDSQHSFLHGTQAHQFIRDLLKARFSDENQEREVVVDLENNIRLIGHIDDLIEGVVIEAKSAKQYGFNKMKDGDLGDEYISQNHVYMKGTGASKTIQVIDNKPQRTVPAIVTWLGHAQDDVSRVMATLEVEFDEFYWLDLQAKLQQVASPRPPNKLEVEYDPKGGVSITPWNCTYCEWAHQCRVSEEGYELISRFRGKVEKGYKEGWSVALAKFE